MPLYKYSWTPTNDGTGSGLDADLLDGKNTGTSGNTIPLLDGSNIWSTIQSFRNNAAGNSANLSARFTTTDGDNHGIWITPKLSAGSYNSTVVAGDSGVFFSSGAQGTGALVIAPWASASSGLRIDSSGNVTLNGTLTVSGGTITAGNVATTLLGGNTTTNILIGTGQTSGTITIGGTGATGAITIGQATTAQTLNLGTGATAASTTKTINIGTGGAASSITNVNIGAVPGGRTSLASLRNNINTSVFIGTTDDLADTGPILTLGAITAGAGLRNGVFTNVALTGGTGAYMLGTVSVGGGAVTDIALTWGGHRYRAGDTLTVPVLGTAIATTGASGTGTTATITTANQGVLAVTGASGTGVTATLTFAAQTVAPYPVGSTIVVYNMNPAGYDTGTGGAVVTACTTTTVSYENVTTAAFVAGGSIAILPFTVGANVTIAGVTPTGYNQTNAPVTAISATSSATSISYANVTTGAQTVAGTITQGTAGTSATIPVSTVRGVEVYATDALGGRIRLERNNTSVNAGDELGSIYFGSRDASVQGSGDTARITAVGAGTSGGGALQFWTSANGGAASLAVAISETKALRLYNTAGTFYHEVSNNPAANRTISLPDGNVTLTAGTTVVTDNTNQTVQGTKTFSGVTHFTASGNQLLLKNGTTSDPTVIHRADGANYYILLSAAGTTPSGTWNALRPLYINQSTGLLSSENGQSFTGGTNIGGVLTLSNSAGSSGQVLTSQGAGVAPVWSTVGGIASTVTTTATSKTLAVGEYCTVTAEGQTITLPASPSAGNTVKIGVLNFTNTIVARNGQNIMSLAENMTIDAADATVTLTFIDATRGWRIS